MEGTVRSGLGTQAWKMSSRVTRVGCLSVKAGATALLIYPAPPGSPEASIGSSWEGGDPSSGTLVSSHPPPHARGVALAAHR